MASGKGKVAIVMSMRTVSFLKNLFRIESCHATGTTIYSNNNTIGPGNRTQYNQNKTIQARINTACDSENHVHISRSWSHYWFYSLDEVRVGTLLYRRNYFELQAKEKI